MRKRLLYIGIPTLALLASTACSKKSSSTDEAASVVAFTVSGSVTYDWVPALDNVTEGGVKLSYAAKASRPARRVTVQALSGSTVVASATANDSGAYSIAVPTGTSGVTIRALASSTVTANVVDGVSPDICSGATWDIRVVDNVTNSASSATDGSLRALWSVTDSTLRTADATGVNLNAALTYSSGYTNRAAAPFALLDTLITQIELVCQGSATVSLPLLYVNWSGNNTASSGNKYVGDIGTSHFTTEGASSVGNLYILGKENVDTDEYDDHVIGHEFGHYLEAKLFRSDSIGGSHSLGDSLDARVAFGEGYGNALSGMTFNDPIYVDTSGASQNTGFVINNSTAPSTDDRGVYSERSAQYFLWKLYDNRDGTANSGDFVKIYNIMKNYQATTAAFTSLQSFASYYNAVYGGSSESASTLWSSNLDTPYNSLCSGACAGTGDTADPYDVDNDIGTYYNAQSRKYEQGTGSTKAATFWRLYRTVSSGSPATDSIDLASGAYSYTANKFGASRWFKYTHVAASGTVTITVTHAGGCSQGTDYLDLLIYASGDLFTGEVGTAECPAVSFSAVQNAVYTFHVRGANANTASYTVSVSP